MPIPCCNAGQQADRHLQLFKGVPQRFVWRGFGLGLAEPKSRRLSLLARQWLHRWHLLA